MRDRAMKNRTSFVLNRAPRTLCFLSIYRRMRLRPRTKNRMNKRRTKMTCSMDRITPGRDPEANPRDSRITSSMAKNRTMSRAMKAPMIREPFFFFSVRRSMAEWAVVLYYSAR
jgi:hypothetical protein